ncbi:hypothetical protein P5V15_005875 [Pogonomyrmex californicus]
MGKSNLHDSFCRIVYVLNDIADNLVFTDCFVGFAGSVNDSRIFRNLDLWMSIQENRTKFFSENEYIIANKAYPVLSRAFSLLKGRFRRNLNICI